MVVATNRRVTHWRDRAARYAVTTICGRLLAASSELNVTYLLLAVGLRRTMVTAVCPAAFSASKNDVRSSSYQRAVVPVTVMLPRRVRVPVGRLFQVSVDSLHV